MTNLTLSPALTVAPGHRMVPAKIGRDYTLASIMRIPCPDWCADDHVSNWQHSVDDVQHTASADAGVEVPTLLDETFSHYNWWSVIGTNPAAADPRLRAAHIVVSDDSDEAHLTPEMAESLADDLIGWAAQLRHQARAVRTAHQAAGGGQSAEAVA